MVLKRLSPKERKEAARLLAGYWKERGMPEYGEAWAQDYLVKGHTKEIARDEFFAFEEKGTLAGIVSLVTDVSGLIQIRDLVVKPAFRERRVGRKILKEAVRIAQERKSHKVFALTFPEHEKLFLSLGFEKEGILKSHFVRGEDLAVMSLFLRKR